MSSFSILTKSNTIVVNDAISSSTWGSSHSSSHKNRWLLKKLELKGASDLSPTILRNLWLPMMQQRPSDSSPRRHNPDRDPVAHLFSSKRSRTEPQPQNTVPAMADSTVVSYLLETNTWSLDPPGYAYSE